MRRDRWRQIDEIFDAALDLTARERSSFLDDACGDDASLRREVEKMLAIEARTGDFIEASALDAATAILASTAAEERREALLGPVQVPLKGTETEFTLRLPRGWR